MPKNFHLIRSRGGRIPSVLAGLGKEVKTDAPPSLLTLDRRFLILNQDSNSQPRCSPFRDYTERTACFYPENVGSAVFE